MIGIDYNIVLWCRSCNGQYNHWGKPSIFLWMSVLFLQFYSLFHCRNISSWRETFPFVGFYYLIIFFFWHHGNYHSYYNTLWITPIIFWRGIILPFCCRLSSIYAIPLTEGGTVSSSYNTSGEPTWFFYILELHKPPWTIYSLIYHFTHPFVDLFLFSQCLGCHHIFDITSWEMDAFLFLGYHQWKLILVLLFT